MTVGPDVDDLRAGLTADCGRCAGLCCVAPAFARSADFAIDKAAGQPCPHLAGDHSCSIHHRLRTSGFPGCVAYDCFGAGQRVVQVTFGARDPADTLDERARLAAYLVVRDLHELLWYLVDAAGRAACVPLRAELQQLTAATNQLAELPLAELTLVDTARQRALVDPVLQRASALVRAEDDGPDLRRADLAGHDLAGADLRGADLRGALLIGADLSGADLRRADLLGADLRATRLRAADLREALYVTRSKLGSASGDGSTALPPGLTAPDHWRTGPVPPAA